MKRKKIFQPLVSINILLIVFMFFTPRLTGQKAISAHNKDVDVLHYNIHLTPDWDKKNVRGNVIISLIVNRPLDHITFTANALQIQSVHNARNESLRFANDSLNNTLTVSLDRNYPVGSEVHLTIHYESRHVNESDPNFPGGSFGKGIRFFKPTSINPAKRKQCWAQSELCNTGYWLPYINDLSDLSTFEFTCTLEREMDFITCGKCISKNDNTDGTVTYQYAAEQPFPIYLAGFVAGEYTMITEEVHGIRMHTWCYPEEKEAATATTDQFAEMLIFLEEKTGVKFPFEHYTQVMVQDYPFPGLTGHQGFSIISDNMIDDFGTHRDFLYLWDGVEFNALASQWFGNMIVPEKTEDLWLTKSFAHYFEGKFTGAQHGYEEYLLWYQPWEYSNVFGDWFNGNRHPIVPIAIDDSEQFAGDSYCKYRGALVLHMLEKEIGEETLLSAIREFLIQFAFQPAATSDFQTIVERVSNRELDWFFTQWVYQTGHPVFQISDSYDKSTKTYQIEITQTQEQDTSGKQPFYFSGHITLEIDGKPEELWLEPKAKNTFRFVSSAHPASVYVNTRNRWIAEMLFDRTLEESLHLLKSSKDAAARQTALNELAVIAQQDSVSREKKELIVDAFHKVISAPGYWRFRYNAIGQLRSIQAPPYNQETLSLLRKLIDEETSWIRAAAITSLGMTGDSAYADIYIQCFEDLSDRVRNAAAIALGKTKSSRAFDALLRLREMPSWKNQSLMHCLSGLSFLDDPRGEEIALRALEDISSPRWFLGNGWDYPVVAVQTLSALGKTEKALALLLNRFYAALKENNKDDVFYQVLLIATLQNPEGIEIIDPLKQQFPNDPQASTAIAMYEDQLKQAVSKNQ